MATLEDAPGATEVSRPAKPRVIPVSTRRVGRGPLYQSQSKRTIHKGMIATIKAADPDGTRCSAQARPPLPTVSNRNPIGAVAIQWSRVGRGAPRKRTQA